VPGAFYQLGFAAFEPAGQPSTGAVNVLAGWNSGPNCDGAPLSQPTIGLGHIAGWQTRSTGLFSPAGAHSVLIRIGAFRDETFITGDYRAEVDHVTFGSAEAVAIPMTGLFGLASLALLLILGGLLVMHRVRF
jgi:hypothetical protein